ncbi:MAG: diacylglycerol kinase family protein [Prolixibacteraceae bacterium]|nr:diacylglycerol kinase family protein [Prolixibacteraceae bacterium]
MKKKFSIKARLKSFGFAFQGLTRLVRYEHNAWIHFMATIVVLGLAWWLELTRAEWILLVLVIGLVWMAEAFNTALEHLADAVSTAPDRNIKQAKDMAAAAVLIAALVALITGLLIFVPRLIQLMN